MCEFQKKFCMYEKNLFVSVKKRKKRIILLSIHNVAGMISGRNIDEFKVIVLLDIFNKLWLPYDENRIKNDKF